MTLVEAQGGGGGGGGEGEGRKYCATFPLLHNLLPKKKKGLVCLTFPEKKKCFTARLSRTAEEEDKKIQQDTPVQDWGRGEGEGGGERG